MGVNVVVNNWWKLSFTSMSHTVIDQNWLISYHLPSETCTKSNSQLVWLVVCYQAAAKFVLLVDFQAHRMSMQRDCVNVDIPGMCSSENVRSLWSTADTSGHTLLAALSVEICCRWKVRLLCHLLFPLVENVISYVCSCWPRIVWRNSSFAHYHHHHHHGISSAPITSRT